MREEPSSRFGPYPSAQTAIAHASLRSGRCNSKWQRAAQQENAVSLFRLTALGAALGAALCMAPACAAAGPPSAKPSAEATANSLPTPVWSGVQINPFDTLKILVFGVPTLSGEYPVDQVGRIKMPLIGEIEAAGRTPSSFSTELQTRLTERFLQNADVTVSIVGGGVGAMVTVEGTVRSPGMFPMRGQMSLLQSIALSGGPGQGANQKRVVVFRTIEGKRHAAVFNLADIRHGRAEDPKIFGGDIVVVDGSATSGFYQQILKSLPFISIFTPF